MTLKHFFNLSNKDKLTQEIIDQFKQEYDINETDNHNHTALHIACYCSNFNINNNIKLLVNNGIDVNAKTSKNTNCQTALLILAENGNLEMIEYLINEAKADSSVKNSLNQDILYHAHLSLGQKKGQYKETYNYVRNLTLQNLKNKFIFKLDNINLENIINLNIKEIETKYPILN